MFHNIRLPGTTDRYVSLITLSVFVLPTPVLFGIIMNRHWHLVVWVVITKFYLEICKLIQYTVEPLTLVSGSEIRGQDKYINIKKLSKSLFLKTHTHTKSISCDKESKVNISLKKYVYILYFQRDKEMITHTKWANNQ